MNEIKELKTCPECGQTGIKNLGVHARYCKAKKQEKPQEQPERPENPELPEAPQLIITDVQATTYDPDLVAWFKDADGNRITKHMNHVGLVHDERGIIPSALVLAADGSLVPPYLIHGFLGVFPEYQQFPEVEPQPEVREEAPKNTFIEPSQAPQSEEHNEKVITPIETHAQEPEKKSLFAGIFGKKKKTEKPQSDMTNAELASEIIKASNGGAI